MATRTVGDMVSSVSRRLGGGVPGGEIQQALYDTDMEINGSYPWPWLYKYSTLAVNGPYTTGTIALTSGSTTVTGTGTTWVTTWKYKTLRVGSIDYDVASVESTTSLTLAQAPVIDTNETAASYTILQTIYAMPSDWTPGTDIILYNQSVYYRIRKVPVFSLVQTDIWNRTNSTSYVASYADFGYDATNFVYRIKISPPPAATAQYKMVYRGAPPALNLVGSRSVIPDKFIGCVEKLAEARLRRIKKLGGHIQAEAEGNKLLRAMKREIDVQGTDNRPESHGFSMGAEASWRDGPFAAIRGTS